MGFDDDDDLEEFELIELEDDDEDTEPIPEPGITGWSALWILMDAFSTILNAIDHVLYNVKVDLVYRHNKKVDTDSFVGSVEAGLEQL